ncbi:MAG: hypothetical protein BWY38_02333 [Ignavibacteria bacterium ADurb.Bin266]|jgi:hypothetical protein|nr:MAG: hypothetical protein BWY38_02333 [Ignavibacteria bacterium ADurb.Bin266]
MILSNVYSVQKLLNVILNVPVPFAGSKDDRIIFNHTLTGLV